MCADLIIEIIKLYTKVYRQCRGTKYIMNVLYLYIVQRHKICTIIDDITVFRGRGGSGSNHHRNAFVHFFTLISGTYVFLSKAIFKIKFPKECIHV